MVQTTEIRIKLLKAEIQRVEKIAKLLKDELWHVQIDLIALKEKLKGIEYEKNIDSNNDVNDDV
jgi:hypothetical protein